MAEPNYNLLNTATPAEAAMAPIRGMGAVNALQSQQLQNQAAQMEIQNALAEQEAYKRAAQGEGSVSQNLLGAGLGGKAAAYQKTTAEAQKLGLESQLKQAELHRADIGQLAVDPTDQNVMSYLQKKVQTGQISPQQAMQAWQDTAGLPYEQRKQKFMQQAVSLDTLFKTQADVQQRMQGTVPAGYRMTQQGTLEAIPGGPTTTDISPAAQQKRNEKFPAAEAAYKTFEKDSGNLIANLELLKKHKGLEGILGTIYGRTPSIDADSQAAQQLYDQILAQGQFNTLSALRQSSPTGGALGNVSDRENQALRQAFGALGRVQSKEDFVKAIDRVIENVKGSQEIIKDAFDETYAYRNSTPTTSAGGKGNQKWQSALTDFENQGGGRK